MTRVEADGQETRPVYGLKSMLDYPRTAEIVNRAACQNDDTRRREPKHCEVWILCVCAAAFLLAAAGGRADDPARLTGAPLNRALEQPVSIVRERASAREALGGLSSTQRVACWLDRRIDPSTNISLQLQQAPLRAAFDEVARQLDAACGRLGDTLVIGRAEQLDPLLTQAEALTNRLKRDRLIPAARRLQLTGGATISWADLDRPADVLAQISRQWDLEITNPDAVPHDLWAGGTAAGVNAVESLSLVLGQFDLSCEWGPAAKRITIVPLSTGVTVERTHRPRGMSLTEGQKAVETEWPGIEVRRSGTALIFAATVLQHDAIAIRLGEAAAPAAGTSRPVPVSRRQYSKVRIIRKPAGDVLKSLVAQGLDIDYDANALAAAGVDLNSLVTLEFEVVTAEELIRAICEPVGLTYAVEGDRVTLRVKSPP